MNRAETNCRIARVTGSDLTRLETEHPEVVLEFQRFITQRFRMRILEKDHLIEGLVRGINRPAFQSIFPKSGRFFEK